MERGLKKENYLVHIRNAMRWHFSSKEIQVTLEDINLLFEAGKADGKSEALICRELGKPKDFVENLLRETTDKKSLPIAVIIFTAGILVTRYFYENISPAVLFCIPVLGILALVWYFFGGFCFYDVYKLSLGDKRKYLFYGIFTSGIAVLEQVFISVIIHGVERVQELASITYIFSNIAIVGSVVLFLVVAYKYYKGYYTMFGILALLAGIICTSCSYNKFLRDFTTPSQYYICVLPYILGFIISIAYFLYLSGKERKRL